MGLFAHPHGFTVDKDGKIWTTDTNDEEKILGMPAKNAQGVTMGQEVLKISPTGNVLMAIEPKSLRRSERQLRPDP